MKVRQQFGKSLVLSAAVLMSLAACSLEAQRRESAAAPGVGSTAQANSDPEELPPTARIPTLGSTLGSTLASAGVPSTRRITFNGRPLTAVDEQRLDILERLFGSRLPNGNYWYDNRTGAAGVWGGPFSGLLPPGLGFGGPLPANASGGGTGTFVNGRELHPLDVAHLGGYVLRGYFWMDAYGNFGYENGPMMGNLAAFFASPSGGGGGQHRVYSAGELAGVISNSAGACTNSGCYYPGQ